MVSNDSEESNYYFFCLDISDVLGNFLYGADNPCGEGIIPTTCNCPDGASFTPDLRFE
jgi:hypothetical protein